MNVLADLYSQNYDDAYARAQRGVEQRARVQAGRALAGGDYKGAAGELYGAGMLDQGSQVQNYGQAQQDRVDEREQSQLLARRKEAADALSRVSTALAQIGQDDSPQTLAARFETLQRLKDPQGPLGQIIDTSILNSVTPEHLTRAGLAAFNGQVSRAAEDFTLSPGSKRFGPDGKLIAEAPFAPNYQRVGEGETLIQVNPQSAAAPAGAGRPSDDDVWGAAIMQESGGRPGVLGPETAYGRAQGMTQMLPATAQAMANKLGLPWRPELMTGTSEEAADYQKRLGRAYFDEGLEKYGGDQEKALMYYHGGPDESIWGPKTRQHARAVMGRLEPYQTAGLDDAAGARVIARGNPKPKRTYRDATPQELRGMGYPPGTRAQVDSETGKLENIRQPTEAQTKATGYTRRVLGANDHLNDLARRGIFKPSANLLISERNGVTRIAASRPEDRQFLQAAKNWLAPILRKDTGAAVTDNELVTYMDMYIPRPEDDVGTLIQKADARQEAMIALSQETGGVYGATYGDRSFKSLRPLEPKAGGRGKPQRAQGSGWKVLSVE